MSIQTKEQTITNGSGEPIRGTWGAPILGPRNIPVERENPDLLASPETDAGTVPNLKFSYSAARNRLRHRSQPQILLFDRQEPTKLGWLCA